MLGLIVVHWFADFVLQTDQQAQNKWNNTRALLEHTGSYALVFLLIASVVMPLHPWLALSFALITGIIHTGTDYVTSKITHRLWNEKKVHEFFVVIGFDQVLHYIQLVLTLHYLTGLI